MALAEAEGREEGGGALVGTGWEWFWNSEVVVAVHSLGARPRPAWMFSFLPVLGSCGDRAVQFMLSCIVYQGKSRLRRSYNAENARRVGNKIFGEFS
jgi:hypothetical protein